MKINDLNILIGIALAAILTYASYKDIRTKEIPDTVHIAILLLSLVRIIYSFVSQHYVNILDMLAGGFLSAIPLFIAAVITEGKIGGADIKLMAAIGLLLGLDGGISALFSGLMLSIIVNLTFLLFKKINLKSSFPLVPYLSIGCFFIYILKMIGVL